MLDQILKAVVATVGILVILMVTLIFLLFVSPLVTTRDITSQSRLVGQVLTSEEPLVYIKNLPYFRDVSTYIRRNTLTVNTRETSYFLEELRNSCGNCLDDERLTTPIRIELVPVGTAFTVVKEFRLNYVNLFPESYDYVLLRDDKGNLSQARKRVVETGRVDTINSGLAYMENEPWLGEITEYIQSNGSANVVYCPETWKVYTKKVKNTFSELSAFISDFKLRQDVELERDYKSSCDDGVLITFKTLDAFMTTQYYLSEWSMYGDLKLGR